MSSHLNALTKLVGHCIAASESDPVVAALYEYLLAGNGLFVRAKRREFSVSLPLSVKKIWGLPIASIGISWNKPRIPNMLWREILFDAQQKNPSSNF